MSTGGPTTDAPGRAERTGGAAAGHPADSAGGRRLDRIDGLLAVTVLALAAAVRVDGLDLAPIGDELPLLGACSWEAALLEPESAINPPLQRLLLTGRSPHDGLWVARRVSLLASSLAAGLLLLLARRLGSGRVAAGIVGVWWALDPHAVDHGTLARSYAWWSLAAMVHLHGLVGCLHAPTPRRGSQTAALVGAVGMVWLHYLSVPILLGEGLALAVGRSLPGRAWWRLYGVAALAFAPLGALIVALDAPYAGSSSTSGPAGALHLLLTYGYGPLPLPGAPTALGAHTTALAFVALHLLAWGSLRHALPPARAAARGLLGAQAGMLLAVVLFDPVQSIRPPATILWLAISAPLLARSVAFVRPGAPVAQACIVALLAAATWLAPASLREAFARNHAGRAAERSFVVATLQGIDPREDDTLWVERLDHRRALATLDPRTRPVREGTGYDWIHDLAIPSEAGTIVLRVAPRDGPPPPGLHLWWREEPGPCPPLRTGGGVQLVRCP